MYKIPVYNLDGEIIGWEETEEVTPPPPVPDPIAQLQEDNKLLKAQLSAAIQSNQTLEDCLVEMASVVYA